MLLLCISPIDSARNPLMTNRKAVRLCPVKAKAKAKMRAMITRGTTTTNY